MCAGLTAPFCHPPAPPPALTGLSHFFHTAHRIESRNSPQTCADPRADIPMQLAQRLAQAGHLNESDLPRIAEAHAANPDRPLHELLIEKGLRQGGRRPRRPGRGVRPGARRSDPGARSTDETLQAMPLKLVHRRNLMPLSRENGTLVVATGDPYDVYALDELQTLTGLHVQPVLASPREISPAHQDPLRRRRRHRHRPGRRSATRTTSSCSKTSRPTTARWPSRPRRPRSSSWSTKS